MRRWGALLGVGLLGALAVPGADASPAQVPEPGDVATAVLRQVCDLQWVAGVCEATGYPEPQYRTGTDPSPAEPLVQRVGAVHEHSGYSDGDPDTRPSDYFAAAREGANVSDDGERDTGIVLDYLLSSEHSENEKLPVTTAEACINPDGIPDAIAQLELAGAIPPLACSNVDQPDHYRKWDETLAQAIDATDFSPATGYDGFTALRGFEWTNDYVNHLGVYFSRNVVNAKVDGSYVTIDRFWDWLREPATEGGGDDALVVFNHPGGLPALTPFDGDLPHNQILADTLGGENWDDVAYVPDVDDRVVGIEVNGGDDLSWYVRALRNGWHLGPVAAEDEHQREWASTEDGKTLVLTRGRSPRDYYFAFQQRRTAALAQDLVGGQPGAPAVVPTVLFWTGGESVQDPAAGVMGSIVDAAGPQSLELEVTGLPEGYQAVLVGDALDAPRALGTAAAAGTIRAAEVVEAPATGEDWWFVVVCAPEVVDCGLAEEHSVVTAPIWLRAAQATAPVPSPAGPAVADPLPASPAATAEQLPATGSDLTAAGWWLALLAAAGLVARARRPA
jgi:hypothetical protein